MSPKLKPLLLPQLVEQRRKLETQTQHGTAMSPTTSTGTSTSTSTSTSQSQGEPSQSQFYYTHHSSSSSSDLASPSPVTPTFSRAHSRYSGSTSSLEQLPSCCESPASPTQPANGPKVAKSLLPDVQEDPLREDEGVTVAAGPSPEPYDYLCGETSFTRDAEPNLGSTLPYLATDLDYYDIGFLSDSDFSIGERAKKLRRPGDDSHFAGLSTRLGSKIPGFSRWRSASKGTNFTFSPASDPALVDYGTGISRAVSRAASSRSSSISAPTRRIPDRFNEPPSSPTPALSFYDSTDSVLLTDALDIDREDVRQSLERERAMATTPLLPPLLLESPTSSIPPSLQTSPLQSPTMVGPQLHDASLPPAPSLSSKHSVSSFRPVPTITAPSLGLMNTELPSPIPNLIEHDEWSDRLGHANFVIMPRPYRPTETNLDALTNLRADWDLAKINYAKHLCRTGEHYGMTSNTYMLTQTKWAEIEREWHALENDLIDEIIKTGNESADAAETCRRARQGSLQPLSIPKMLEAEGKFPQRGDVDIVGPMQRDAVMVRELSPSDDKRNVSTWLKSLVGKVALRK